MEINITPIVKLLHSNLAISQVVLRSQAKIISILEVRDYDSVLKELESHYQYTYSEIKDDILSQQSFDDLTDGLNS